MGDKTKDQLLIKIDKDLKAQFKQACKEADTSVSREVRRMIKQFIKEQDS